MSKASLYVLILFEALSLPAGPLPAQAVQDLPEADRFLDGEAAEVFSVGAAAGEPWEEFAGVRAVDFDREGNLYVLDSSARVLRFDPHGRFLNQLGKKGEGPGEINLALTMVVRSDGTVVVLDPSSGYHVFEPNGDFIETIRPPEPTYSNHVVLSGDDLILAGGLFAGRIHGTDGQPILRQELASGSSAEILLDAAVPSPELSSASAGQYTFRRPPLLAPTIRIALGGAGEIATAYGTGWTIDVVDATGQRRAVIRRPVAARATTSRDREALSRRRASQSQVRVFGGAAGARVPPGAVSAGELTTADSVPVIRDLRGDGTGVLFVGRETDPVGEPHQQVDIVTTDGDYIGSLRDQALPEAFGPDGLAAYVEVDELGVQRVVVRRLPEEWFR